MVLFMFISFSDSDDSGDESSLEAEPYLMEKVDLVESGLLELSREHQFKVKVCSYVTGLGVLLFYLLVYGVL